MTGVISNNIKEIKNIKLVAGVFLVIEFLLLIYWGFTAHDFLEFIFENITVMVVFLALLLYQAVFWGLTVNIMIKKADKFLIKSARTKLKIIFGALIVPAIILFLLYIISIFVR